MSEQSGLIYRIHPDFVATPNTNEGKRLYQCSLDDLLYFKKHDGTDELFNPLDFVPQYRGQTTDGILKELFISDVHNQRTVFTRNSSGAMIYFFVARNIANAATGYFYNYIVPFKDVNGITTISGGGQVNLDSGDAESFAWTAGFDIVNNNELRFQVKGEAGKTINWAASQIKITQVLGA